MVGRLLIVASLAAASAAGAETGAAWTELALPPAPGLSASGGRILRAHVEGGVDAELRWADFRDLRGELTRFYDGRRWTLAWTDAGRPTDAAWQVAGLLAAAARKGLDPLDYGGDEWEARLASLERPGAGEAERVRADVALTVSALRYAADLAHGRIRPVPGTEILGRIQPPEEGELVLDLVAAVEAAAEAAAGAADAEKPFEQLEPTLPGYRRALALLPEVLALAAAERPTALLPPAEGPVAPESYPAAATLAARLHELGDLDGSAEPVADGEQACASPLAEAVARFQERHGLEATGYVDEATVHELNVTLLRRADQLALSLERWRWIPRHLPAASIIVNVPEFRLRATNGRALSMRVVVGQAYRWGTPVFASDLERVIFRPPWKVPMSIQRMELVPRIAANRGLLAASGFEVLDSSESAIPPLPTPALLAGLRSGALRLRQRAGPESALGLVKFDLAHEGSIYLHDTPATELFSRSRRDFSHGCIRVEDPVALAEWVLSGEPGWRAAEIRRAMRGTRTLEVPLTRRVPVLVGYFTAMVGEDRVPRFVEDIYGQDGALATALEDERIRRRGVQP
jgi:murein L,D-transpeptidase YcbB/YkuD